MARCPTVVLGPDYMSRAVPVSRAASVCRDDFQPGITLGKPARLMADAKNHGRPERAWFWCGEGLMSRVGPTNAITWKNLSPVSRDPGTAIPGSRLTGWPGCHVIAKLIFMVFNKRAEIPSNWHQPGSCNQTLRNVWLEKKEKKKNFQATLFYERREKSWTHSDPSQSFPGGTKKTVNHLRNWSECSYKEKFDSLAPCGILWHQWRIFDWLHAIEAEYGSYSLYAFEAFLLDLWGPPFWVP